MVLFKRIILLLLVTCVIIGCKEESMQKLKFVNANGIELDLTSGHYGITKWNGFSNANLNLQTQQVPYQDGSVFIDGLLNNRELSVTLSINDNNNLAKRYELRNELIRTLNPKLGEGYLYYKNDYLERRIKVIPQLPVIDNKNSNESGAVKASLSWTACGVFWEDVEETSVNINMGERVNIENKGDVPISPKITFTGSALNPVLRNLNNKTKISIKGLLNNSVLELAKGKKTFLKTKYGFTNNNNYNNFEENEDFQLLFSTNCISKTEDFENFETVYIMPNETVICSGYGRGLFFYGGDNLKKSSDGETWETIADKPAGTVRAIYYDKIDDVFYFGIYTKLYSTSDLSTFTEIGSIGASFNAITRHNSLIVCVGQGGNCYKYDGTNFTAITTGVTSNIYNVASDGTNLVIVGANGLFRYSTDDGETWVNEDTTANIYGICYSNTYGLFFACGDIIVGKGLPDNMVWEELESEARSVCKESKLFGQIELLGVGMAIFNGSFEKLCNYPYDAICSVYFKGKYIAAGAFGHIYTADDFTWWEESSASGTISNNIKFAEIADDTAYFFTTEGDIISTTDGVNFKFKSYSEKNGSLKYFNGYYYTLEDNEVYRFDLEHINDMTLIYTASSVSFDYNKLILICNNKLIIAGDNGVIVFNGSDWVEYSTSTLGSVETVVYYNNKYYLLIVEGSDKYKVYETTDFENFTEILSEYNTETSMIYGIFVANNEFFFEVILLNEDLQYFNSILYRGIDNPTSVRTLTGLFYYVDYLDGKYYLQKNEYDEVTEDFVYCTEVTDLNEYSQNIDNWLYIDNSHVYTYNPDTNIISYNGNSIGKMSGIPLFQLSNNLCICDSCFYTLPDGKAITSPLTTVKSVYSDNSIIFITCNSGLFTIEGEYIKYKNDNRSNAVTGDNTSIYLISNFDIEKYLKSDLSIPVATYTITHGTINQGACVYYNNYVIWATDTAIVTYNLNTGIKKEISTNVLICDLQIIDGIVFGVGEGGIVYTSDMQTITELYKMSFVFEKFVRGDIKKFIALYGALGELIILEDENIISMITDISFELQEGENEIVLNCDSGYINAIMTYRQRYAGV